MEDQDEDSKYDYAYAMREINEAAMEALTSGERAARGRPRRPRRWRQRYGRWRLL